MASIIENLKNRLTRSEKPKEGPSKSQRQAALVAIRRQEAIVRQDIAKWREARYEATRVSEPKQHRLQLLYKDVMDDAKMTSQVGMRINKSQSADWFLKKGKEIDEEAMEKFKDTGLYDKLVRYIVEAQFYNNSLTQFTFGKDGKPDLELVPRPNVSPLTGRFYPDVFGSESVLYRERPDFGKWILEFCPDPDDLGLLNKATPYVLMKKFALSCWSELCEIYGIPPRVLKTDTQDPKMLEQAETMMKEIGSAAYFIIDTEEEFEFAQASSTNGDVYNNFIATCDEQISLLNLGAMLGQDTINGNRSKEEASTDLMEIIVEADKRKIEYHINRDAIPAMESLGIIPAGLRFEYAKATDTEKLWKMVYQASAYYDFDVEWLKKTFGMEITGPRMNPVDSSGNDALNAGNFNFFG